jgi:GDSL-like Lipase/Acylhydrolase family
MADKPTLDKSYARNLGSTISFDKVPKKLNKVSCLGDSNTSSSYLLPNSSYYWYPGRLNEYLAMNTVKTIITGSNLFNPATAVKSPGVTVSGTEFTLAADEINTNPRFAINTGLTAVAGKQYLITAEIDSTNSEGSQLALRYYVQTSAGVTIGSEVNFGGFDESTGGYKKVYAVLSSDYLMSPGNVGLLQFGGELIADGTVKTGKIKNFEIYELTNGIAVHNQGINGETASGGLSRISQVTTWNPDVCIIGYGTNDIRTGVTLSDFKNTLKQIVSTLRNKNCYPILATLPPLGDSEINNDLVPTWNDAIREMSNQLGISVWDRYWTLENGDLSYITDGRHPTKEGFELLGYNASRFLLGQI